MQRALPIVIATTWDGGPVGAEEAVTLEVDGTRGLVIAIDAPFHGDRVPAGPPGRTDRLWEHEVVELFFAEAPDRGARYLEVELGPHGHWLALAFDGYRRRRLDDLVMVHDAVIAGSRWRAAARMQANELARAIDRVGAINAYAIHGVGAARRYLAAHPAPPGRHEGPDFHRLEHFAAVAER